MHYPFLSLSQITIDPTLARRLPRPLAFYYLAFPIAQDEDELTLVMAHPGNRASITILEQALGARIVPVQAAIDEIRTVLNQLWPEQQATGLQMLGWTASPERIQSLTDTATLIGQAISREAIYFDTSQTTLENVVSLAQQEHYHLTVIDTPPDLNTLLRDSATPILLVDRPINRLQAVLLILRGHSPDESALEWMIPLAQTTHAAITVLAVAAPVAIGTSSTRILRGLAPLLTAENTLGQHIAACTQRLSEAGVSGRLRVRQGQPEQEIAAEFSENPYDLMVIAAEAKGDFIQQMLGLITPPRNPILVMKPTTR